MKVNEFIPKIIEREFDPKETLKLLTYGRNKALYWCWGVSKKVNYWNKALLLQVAGLKHKGKVYITLAWDDTYTVYITTNQHRVIAKHENIYFDMLADVINAEIESH